MKVEFVLERCQGQGATAHGAARVTVEEGLSGLWEAAGQGKPPALSPQLVRSVCFQLRGTFSRVAVLQGTGLIHVRKAKESSHIV